MARTASKTKPMPLNGHLLAALQSDGTDFYSIKARSIAKAVKALDEFRANPNPFDSYAAHHKKVQREAARVSTKIQTEMSEAFGKLKNSAAVLSDQIAQELNLNETQYAAEIRASLRGKSESERHKILNKAVKEKDSATVAAVIRAPGHLSGLSEEMQRRYENDFSAAHAGGLGAQLDAQLKEYERFNAMAKSADNIAASMFDSEELEAAENAARINEQALSAINESFSNQAQELAATQSETVN